MRKIRSLQKSLSYTYPELAALDWTSEGVELLLDLADERAERDAGEARARWADAMHMSEARARAWVKRPGMDLVLDKSMWCMAYVSSSWVLRTLVNGLLSITKPPFPCGAVPGACPLIVAK